MEVPLLQINRGSTVEVRSTYDPEIEGFYTDARTGGKFFKLVFVKLECSKHFLKFFILKVLNLFV
jgi:hypothetical protein